jgi:hypothetical protein
MDVFIKNSSIYKDKYVYLHQNYKHRNKDN